MKEDYKSEIAKSARDDEAEQDEEDFASLLESSQYRSEARIRRDAKVQGTVVSVGGEWVFLDVGGKSEGCISCEELLNQDGQLRVQVGDTVTAYVVDIRPGEIVLSTKMTSAASEDAIRGAFQSGLPVEGIVQSERKGGYAVTIFGKPAFCPYSQIDIQSGEPPEKFVGKRFSFRIIEYSDRGRNIVLSRKEILEEERLENLEELKRTLSPGDLVTGTVQKLARFGAFVDIGGVEGLVPMSELAWYRVGDVSDILTPGQEIVVRILELDWANQRISLSLKQTQEDPGRLFQTGT
ncbi:MAG: S1 RNA-binding domain-containing protein, partial [Deltaproteobacteria bacterium]|nr:S1 RNA-binding domain-containing protein [Deltaproteobacteria bacterium]